MKKQLILMLAFIALISLTFVGIEFASAQDVGASISTVCCEKTKSGLFCQDVPESQCDPTAKPPVPTSCQATSYCKPGTCFDSKEGTCLDNTPQIVCNANGGIWTDKEAPQCELGCCVLGDQAAFVTLTKCKKLSSDLGLETNYKKDLKSEVSCIASILGQEKGACVFEFEFQKTCRVTTRAECDGGVSGNITKGTFFKDKLCSSEELGTNCGPSTKTSCIAGKTEVYTLDTCGNTANIYNPGKQNWEKLLDKSEAGCNWKDGSDCGNCDYTTGSVCRTDTKGNSKCVDLNCKNVVIKGEKVDKVHGESWCVYNDAGGINNSNNAVGSRFYKHYCINGEELVEACDEFRQQTCVESQATYANSSEIFTQASCRVNRWQDCVAQSSQTDCENSDNRDCRWTGEVCVPIVSPGSTFWEGTETPEMCAIASVQCEAIYKKKLYKSKKWHGECVTKSGKTDIGWLTAKSDICHAVGDCVGTVDKGATLSPTKSNWLGIFSKAGF